MTEDQKTKPAPAGQSFIVGTTFLVAFAILSFLVFQTVRENSVLAAKESSVPLTSGTPWIPAPGFLLPPVQLFDSGGAKTVHWSAVSSGPTLILVRRPRCRHCDAYAETWDRYTEPYRIRGLHTVSFDVGGQSTIRTIDTVHGGPEVLYALGILNPQLLPVVILSNREGKVLQSWPAVLDATQIAEIDRAIDALLTVRGNQ